MKKTNGNLSENRTSRHHSIPELEIIDLDVDGASIPESDSEENTEFWDEYEDFSEEYEEFSEEYEELPEEYEELSEEEEYEEFDEEDGEPVKKGFRINAHIILLSVMAVVFILVIYNVKNWGNYISQEEIFSDGLGTYEDTMDDFIPLLDEGGNLVKADYSDGFTIVTFGNAPFADDRGSENNLANLIAKRADATVYNCAVSGSYLAAENYNYDAKNSPMDIYTFYWLSVLATTGVEINSNFESAADSLGDDIPPESSEVLEILNTLDFNTVDAIVVMYDATDYLMGHTMDRMAYTVEDSKDPTCFTGNLVAGIELFQQNYPHIRIIVMSPTYAFAIDENGEYISSDVQRYGQDVLSTYCILQSAVCNAMGVTFVDNIYGTITEDNAGEYLTDNLHLNQKGRELVASRCMQALFYFD